jgi:hypothetical protein
MYYWDWKKLEWPNNLIAAVLGEEYLDREQPKDLLPSIHYIVSTLPDRVAFVIFQRFKYGKTLQEVAELIGCASRENARRLQARGLRMLRRPSRSEYFKIGISQVQKEDDIRSAKPEDVTINQLDLSTRSYNCLRRSGVATLADILNMTERKLMNVRNIGFKSAVEIIRTVSSLGYSLKEDNDESECV